MNAKIILAFACGAVLASGIVYVAVRPDSKPPAPVVTADTVKPVEQQAPQAPQTPPEQFAQAPVERRSTIAPIAREVTKPSAFSPRHVEPLRIPPQDRPLSYAKTVVPAKIEADVTPPVVTRPNVTPPAATPPVATPPQPAPVKEEVKTPPPPPEPEKPEPNQQAAPNTVTLASGTSISVRIGETLSTKQHKPGDTFLATLDRPLEVDGFVIAERGARCEGRVVVSDPGGRVKGVAEIGVELISIRLSDGQRIRIHTSSFTKDAESSRKTDTAKVAGGAAIGAIIGAIAGGGKGAGIGAGAGGAAGAGDVMLTRGKPAEISVETRAIFRMQDAVTVTEQK
jgi:hypothetical protein